MKSSLSPNSYYLNKSTYINLRWIGIVGQFLTIYIVKFLFGFEFDFISTNIIIIFGALSNLYLVFYYKHTQISNNSSFLFLSIDIFQLTALIFFTGGVLNPFSIFLLIPSVFASSNLNLKTNFSLSGLTIISILSLTFFYKDLPYPLNTFEISNYYFYSIPVSLIIALIFLNFFAITFGQESRTRKEALDKIQEVIAKEHELVSLGARAAAAAHSLGTPLSTIKLISQDLFDQLQNDKSLSKDVDLLISQINRCNEILKKLTLDPTIEDDFIDKNLTISDYINQIVKSFEEISKKEYIIINNQDTNKLKINKSIELVYGLRNFIGNANKFAKSKIFITIESNSVYSEITIEDNGPGYPSDIINRIGDPYIKTLSSKKTSNTGLGLGIFIGKTLLEKNYAKLIFRNSETRGGAEIKIRWANKDLNRI